MSSSSVPAGSFQHAADLLYRSFEDVAFRPDMARCAHCVDDGDVRRLGTDVRHLDRDLVARFVTKSGTTWGDADDLRRIAPRALHLAAEADLPVSRGIVLAKMAAARWVGWEPHQVEAVRHFLLAEWERLLLSPPRQGHVAHRWLRETATAADDLGPFLEAWQRELAAEPGPAAVHLAVLLVNSELRPDFPDTIADLFAPPVVTTARVGGAVRADGTAEVGGPARSSPATSHQFGAWLAAAATETDLTRAATALDHTADARRLALAVERLRRYRTARARR